jgi:hypothetical protein
MRKEELHDSYRLPGIVLVAKPCFKLNVPGLFNS